MNSYYPKVIQTIREFRAIIDCEYPEFEDLSIAKDNVLRDAYLSTMGEERITEWEKVLGIRPLENSTVGDRRETILARIRGQGKLNTALINNIVSTFTGGTPNSWVRDGVLYVEITPPPENKSYQFANVEQELANKVPAHLELQVARNYFEWGDIKTNHSTWQEVLNNFETWNEVLLFIPFS
jgi:hypothetical protein